MFDICNMARKEMNPEDIAHWQSDLYLRVNDTSKRLVGEYEFKNNVEMFIDQIDHVPWFDIPFAWHE